MEIMCENNEQITDLKKTEGCLERTCSTLTVDDVYEIAKSIGSEVEKLIDGYGKDSATGLVPKIVKVLELLESFASRNHALRTKEDELLKAFETLQVQQQKKRTVKDQESDDNGYKKDARERQQKEEEELRRRCEELQAQVLQLQGDNQGLQSRLLGNHAQEDRVQRQEREVMLKLKEVVDKQRDQLRAKVQENSTISKEAEALQEQLDRFMKMNAELRHRQGAVEAQVRGAVGRRADMEADLREKDKEIQRLSSQLERAGAGATSPTLTPLDLTDKMVIDLKDPNRPCFTKQEVRDILTERNELKANLFLVQEELSYYQREILNDERCPGFLLEAVRAAIKKQRTVIKAKMLGVAEDQCSTEEVDGRGPLFESSETETDAGTETDTEEDKPRESRIRGLFGFLTRSSSGRSPSKTSSASTWEILVPDDSPEPITDADPRRSP